MVSLEETRFRHQTDPRQHVTRRLSKKKKRKQMNYLQNTVQYVQLVRLFKQEIKNIERAW